MFYSDYIISVFIAGIVLLIVLSLKFRGDEASIDAVQYRAAKVSSLSLIEAIERDFNNIGSWYLATTHEEFNPDTAFVAFSPGTNPAFIEFWAQTDSVQTVRRVRYEWSLSGKTIQLKDGPVELLDIVRRVNGGIDGQSTNTVTNFEMELRQADGAPALNISGVGLSFLPQQVVIRLRAVSPLGVGEVIEETRWEKTFRPANLWKQRNS